MRNQSIEKLDELNRKDDESIKRFQAKINDARERKRKRTAKINEAERKKRTHHLCELAGFLESVCGPIDYQKLINWTNACDSNIAELRRLIERTQSEEYVRPSSFDPPEDIFDDIPFPTW